MDEIISLSDLLTFMVGAAGFAVAFFTYRWSNLTRRKEALLPLIEKFENNKTLKIAKDILDDYVINNNWDKDNIWHDSIDKYSFDWIKLKKIDSGEIDKFLNFLNKKFGQNLYANNTVIKIKDDHIIEILKDNKISTRIDVDRINSLASIEIIDCFFIMGIIAKEVDKSIILYMYNYYHQINLDLILRSHKNLPIFDEGEMAIRASFDNLLNFFVELEYLHTTLKMIEKKELCYFEYYYQKSADNTAIRKYLTTYEFNLKGKLTDDLSPLSDIYIEHC
ncbi:MAG: hypothetical protein AB7F29_16005 [Candidatus Nitrosocosmicus sp.]